MNSFALVAYQKRTWRTIRHSTIHNHARNIRLIIAQISIINVAHLFDADIVH